MSVLGGQALGHAAPKCTGLRLQRLDCSPQNGWPKRFQWDSLGIRMQSFASSGRDGSMPEASRSMADSDGAKNSAATASSSGRILDTELHVEVEKSYLSYAMSVIVGRALPDVRDGLKPVHRRILFAMHDLGLFPNKPFRKSARVVGEVLGKYHPHGDSAVYDSLVRLAQPFSMRLPLINGHGNFGSQDHDPAAAMRYTECRLQQAASAALLSDLEFDTVDFYDTFDGAQQEPAVLPARLPNLLINGSQGIAVGMATNIPPHNVKEVVNALEALVRNPEITTSELLAYIPAPDFPTGGEIVAMDGIEHAYRSGRGPITVRGRALIEEEGASRDGGRNVKRSGPSKSLIVVTELPYQANKASLVEHIVQLTDEGILQGISDVRDESDRDGMRVVVEIKRGSNAELVLNNLYKHTQLQKRFSCNLVALVNGTPQTLSLRELLSHFLDFRCEVIKRRAKFELHRAEKRAHIVEGLISAQKQLEEVVTAIRRAPDGPAASQVLQNKFGLSTEQADAVLSMALRRMTSLEAGKLQQENRELRKTISGLQALLSSEYAIKNIVVREAQELAASLGDERRTLVRRDVDGHLQQEDIIPNRQSLVVFSRRGYIKRMAADFFSTQSRGGKGQKVASLRDNDSVEEMQAVRDHQSILFFTTDGQCFCVKAYEIPQASRTASGTALPQVIKIQKDQKVTAMLPVDEFSGGEHIMLLSKQGYAKRVALSALSTPRQGNIVMKLNEGDELVWVRKCKEDDDLMVATTDGRVARYAIDLFRPMGRVARGYIAVKLSPGIEIVGMTVLPHQVEYSSDDSDPDDVDDAEVDVHTDGPRILFVTEKGHGKLVPAELFHPYVSRKARGLIGINLSEGDRLATFHVVSSDKSEALLSTSNGLITRIALAQMRCQGRRTKGVILMRTKDASDRISTVTLVEPNDDEDDEESD